MSPTLESHIIYWQNMERWHLQNIVIYSLNHLPSADCETQAGKAAGAKAKAQQFMDNATSHELNMMQYKI